MDSDMRKVVKALKEQGFQVSLTTKGHPEVRDANGHKVATASGSASDYRSFKNFIADCRRAGFKWRR